MSHLAQYLLTESQNQAAYSRFAEVDEPERLEAELALARSLCEQAANAGHAGLAATIAQTIAKISRIEIQNRIATGDLISRDQAFELIRQMVEAVTSEIQNRFDGWEDCLDRIADRLNGTMKSEPALLEDQR